MSQDQAELDLHINAEKQINHNKYLKEKSIALCVELGELLNERPEMFKYWSNKRGDKDKALMEYVDGIHFLLSFGNSTKFDFKKYKYKRPETVDQRDVVLGLFSMLASLTFVNQFEKALTYYLYLAEVMRFTKEDIKAAYYDKVEINYARQENGY